MSLVTGTAGNDSKTFTPGDDYSLSSGTDTLVFNQTDADLTSTTLTSVEILKAGLTDDTTFTVDVADLASGGSVVGTSSGSDTLTVNDANINLTSTTLTSIENLVAGSTDDTTFTIDQTDLASGGTRTGSVSGNTGKDTLAIKGASLNLTSTDLTSIEVIKAGSAAATTFTVDAADLASGGTVQGSTGVDTLIVKDATIDLTSTTLDNIEILKAGLSTATEFIVDVNDLKPGGSVIGSSGSDTLTVNDATINLTSTTLTSIEKLAAGTTDDTTFTVDAADLASNGSVSGNTGTDTLIIKGTAFNLLSTTLTDVEKLQAGSTAATTFTVDASDLASGGEVIANASSTVVDTLVVKSATIDLTNTALTGIEVLKTGVATATSFIVDANDLKPGGSVVGSSGSDTLTVNDATIDLTSTTLTSIEKLAAGTTDDTTFTVNQADLASGGSVAGNTGEDTLTIVGTSFDLSSNSVTDVEHLVGGSSLATTFTVDTADLASGGSIEGGAGTDILTTKGSQLDLTSTTLTSIENLKATSATGTKFIVDANDLTIISAINGAAGVDTLAIADSAYDLTSRTLTSIEKLAAGLSTDTTFTVDGIGAAGADLVSGGSVVGSSGTDTLIILGTSFNLTSTGITSVEILKAASSLATTFTVDQADLVAGGSVVGSTGSDTLVAKGAALDLSSTTLDSIETVKGTLAATTFTIDADELTTGLEIKGSTGTDTLIVKDATADLTSTTLDNIEILKAGLSTATEFIVDVNDLKPGGSVIGSSGSDTLTVNDATINLTSTTLTSIENLNAGTTDDTTFTVDAADLASNGGVSGNTGTDTLIIKGTAFNLLSTTLTDVEKLEAGSTAATTFTVDAADLASGGSVLANNSSTVVDTLVVKNATIDLTNTALTGIDVLKAGVATATNFIVDVNDLKPGGSVVGSSGSDTLTVNDATIDLTSTTLTSIEKLAAGTTDDTTFTVNQADLASGGSVAGSTGEDTLTIVGTSFDLSSTSVTGVEHLVGASSLATTFTVDQGDLFNGGTGGTIEGSSGIDTLTTKGNALDLTSTTLNSIENLKAGSAAATTFTVDTTDFNSLASISGSTGVDTLVFTGTAYDLTSRTLGSIEILKAGATLATTFTVDAADLASGGSVVGNSTTTDTLIIQGVNFNLTSTGINSVEKLQAASSLATTFTLDQADLVAGGSIIGSTGSDTLIGKGATLDLSGTTLTSIETVKGTLAATTFTIDADELNKGLDIRGGTGTDTLIVKAAAADLTSTTLNSIEILKAGVSTDTTFTVDNIGPVTADLVSGGSVVGSSGTDTLIVKDANINLTSTGLTSIEILKAGLGSDTTFTVDAADLAANGSVVGSTGADTLIIKGAAFNLTSTTLTSVEKLQAGSTAATTFTVDSGDLASNGSVIANGSAVIDTLVVKDAAFNLSSTALTGIEVLKAGASVATTFTVNQLDLASGGSVIGSSGSDTLTAADTGLDLTSTTLTSIEKLQASAAGTAFIVDAADLVSGGSVAGGAGTDALTIKGTAFDLTSSAVTSIEILQAGSSLATTFTLDAADIANGGSIVGSSGNDTIIAKGSLLDLTSTSLTSIETLKAGSAQATTFKIDTDDFNTLTAIIGGSNNDTLSINTTAFDLSSTALTSIEILQAGSASNTTFTVNQADLATGGSVNGSTGTDTLKIVDASLDLTSTTLQSIEKLQAGSSLATTFTVDQNDLAAGGSVIGSSGSDTLIVKGSSLDLSATTLDSIETVKGTLAATTFTVDGNELDKGLEIRGSTGNDTLVVKDAAADLTSTTLNSIEILKAGLSTDTVFTLDAADMAALGSVVGSTGTDTLIVKNAAIDLTSTALSSVEILKAGVSTATTFTVDADDLASGGSIVGSSGTDTLISKGTALSLASTALTSVEVLQAGSSSATTFTLDNDDLTHLTTINGNGSAVIDTLVAASNSFNLTSTTLNGVEVLKAGLSTATTFTVDQADLVNGGTVQGSTGNDTLVANGTSLNLTSTTLVSIEALAAGSTLATTFTVDAADLANGGSVTGNNSNDTLVIVGTSFDLRSTSATSIEILKAGSSLDTTFTLDQGDLAIGGSVVGGAGSDTLTTTGTALDLTSTTLSSIETLKAGSSLATTFTVDGDDFSKLTAIVGSSGSDTLAIKETAYDLSSTSLESIENLQAGSTSNTTFTVDALDLDDVVSITGNTGTDTLVINGTLFDVSSVTLNSVEILKAGSSLATTFTVDQGDLATNGTVQGNVGSDTLIATGTLLDLTSTTLVSVERLTGSAAGTTFIVDGVGATGADLVAGGTVAGTGSSAIDTLIIKGTSFDVSSTTLTGIEKLTAGSSLSTTFTVDKEDLIAGGSVIGSSSNDTLIVKNVDIDLTSTALTSIEILQAGTTLATTFNVDAADLASGGTVQGSVNNDVLVIKGTSFDLSSTTLNSIESLKAGSSLATTFTLDASDLISGGSITGSNGSDTVVATGAALDLTSTTLTSIERLLAASTGTTFTVDSSDLASSGSVTGGVGSDALIVKDTRFDLSSSTVTGIEVLQAGSALATTFTVDQADLFNGGSIIGSSGSDTLSTKGTQLDLTSTTLTSIETLKAGSSLATTFKIDATDFAALTGFVGSTGNDTLSINSTAYNLSSTTLTSIEILQAGSSANTTFTVDQADLANGGSVIGNVGTDTLTANGATLDLTSTTLQSVEALQAAASGTIITVDAEDLQVASQVLGGAGTDTLIIKGTTFDLTSTTVTGVEILKASSAAATTFSVDQGDLATGGTVQGSSGNDTLIIAGTSANLTSTTLASIEIIKAASSLGTTFTLDQNDLAASGTVAGHSNGTDTLIINGISLDLTSTTLQSVEILQASSAAGTTFTLDQDDLAVGGSVNGHTSGNDTVAAGGQSLDLSSTTLNSIEILKSALSLNTTFTVNQNDLVNGGTVAGHSSAIDTLAISGPSLDLTSTTLTSIDRLQAASSVATTFTVDVTDLLAGGSVVGNSGNDTLIISNSTAFNLSGTSLTSVEILQTGTTASTTFTVDQADLIGGGSIIGSGNSDTLTAFGTSLDLSNTTLTSIELLKAGSATATTFILDQADLASGGSIAGSTGSDTLTAFGTVLDLSSTSLTSIERLLVGSTLATVLTVDQTDLTSLTTITGNSGIDTLAAGGNSLDLTSTATTLIEILKAGSTLATTFTVDTADLVSGGSVVGNTGNDTLIIKNAAFNLGSTSVTNVEILQAATTITTFTVDQADLAAGGTIIGSGGSDTLTAFGTALDISSTTLTSIERLTAGSTLATTLTVDQTDLNSLASITGNSGVDTLAAGGNSLDLSSSLTTLIEILKAGSTLATTFKVDAADLVSGGSVVGNTGTDTLIMTAAAFNLASTTLSSVEILQAGVAAANTFTIDQADLIAGGSVIGSSGSDTLTTVATGTQIDLSSTTLTSIERLLAGSTSATTFTVDQQDLASLTSINGSTGSDILVAAGTELNLASTTLTSIENLRAGTSLGTTFTVDSIGAGGADLVSGGTVQGHTSAIDTLVLMTASSANLSSTTLTSIEVLKAGSATATTFTVDQADLASGGSVIGSTGSDTLTAFSTGLDLSSTTLTSIERLAAGSATATTFTVDQQDLASLTSINGSTGTDTLTTLATSLDLTSTTLTSIERLLAGSSLGTTFIIDQADLTAGGTNSVVTGHTSGIDTLSNISTNFDLSSTVLNSIEILQAGNTTAATTFTVDVADLLSGGSVIGNSGNDMLSVRLSTVDLSSTTLTSVEIIDAALTTATNFILNQADLASGGTVIGNATVNDTLTIVGTSLDLSSTTLTSVEIITTNSTLGATFIVDQSDLATTGSVTGLAGSDTLVAAGTTLDLSSTVTTSIETLKAGSSIATTFTVDAADLASGGSVIGNSGFDTLAMKTSAFDLSSTTLNSIERLTAAVAGTNATTFTVNQADLASGGSITGGTNTGDVVQIAGSSLDLSSTTLTSIENIRFTLSTGTTFIVNQSDLLSAGSVTGHTSATDTLVTADNALDLTSTTITSVESLKAGLSIATTFTVDTLDLLSGGSVTGSSGTDTLIMKTSAFDLSSTTLTSIETLQAGVSTNTTFTLDLADLAANGSVLGSSGNDTLLIKNANYDLTATSLNSIEILQAGVSLATTFIVDQADLIGGGTVAGSTGTDTLTAAGTSLDLTSTTLTSVEIIRAGTGAATTFIVDANDLSSGGTVWGSSGADQLVIKGTAFDLTSTTLTSIEVLQTGSSLATTFTLDTLDLLSGGSVVGSSGNDTLTVLGVNVDLTSTTLTSIEMLKAASSLATTFLVDQADLLAGGSVTGSTGNDTLSIVGSSLDLSSTTLNSVEILQAGTVAATTFIVDQADLLSGGSVNGNSGIDTLSATGNTIDLTSTSLNSIEVLHANSILATTFTVDQSDLAAGGSVTGNISSDTLKINGTSLDLTSTTLSSVENLQAGSSLATTFTVDQSDLATNGLVIGNSGNDTLVSNGTSLDLSSASLSSIEILKAGSSLATTFTVDQSDLAAGGSVIGGAGSDTLVVNGHSIDLSNTILTSIETIRSSDPSVSSNFAVGGGIGGAAIELTSNGVIDTVSLATGYKVADVTNDASILSHSVTLNHFTDGVGGDVIDLSAITNGTPSSSTDITGYINLSAPATLKDALNIAATANGSSTASVVSFQYGGDTYVLVDNSASNSLTTDDVVVKLTGTHTLSDSSNITF